MFAEIWSRRFWVRRRTRMEEWGLAEAAAVTARTSATTTSRRRTCRTLTARESWVMRRLSRSVGRWQASTVTSVPPTPSRHRRVGFPELLQYIRSIISMVQSIRRKVVRPSCLFFYTLNFAISDAVLWTGRLLRLVHSTITHVHICLSHCGCCKCFGLKNVMLSFIFFSVHVHNHFMAIIQRTSPVKYWRTLLEQTFTVPNACWQQLMHLDYGEDIKLEIRPFSKSISSAIYNWSWQLTAYS